jgi:transposase
VNDSVREHYRKLLGLERPWVVTEVELLIEEKRVEIWLGHRKGIEVICPGCDQKCGVHDEAPEREWRHLDTMQFETLLRARIPRSNCPKCGVKTIAVPWAGKHSRFTLLFEAFAIDVLKASASIAAACELLRLDWSAADRIMKRAVERGLSRRTEEPIRKAGIDEKSFRRGHRYVSILNDLALGRVIEVVEGRDEKSAAKLFETLSSMQREKVEAIALDMWQAFINASRKACPGADLVHDKFHISKHLGEAVNAVRKAEVKKLRADGDTRLEGTRWWWLYSEENIKDEVWEKFEALKDSELKTGRAWSIKECFRWFWEPHRSREEARDYFKQWYCWAIRSQLAPIKKVARMLKAHLEELLNWCDHHITNAVSEGLNSRIQSIKSAARGFHYFESYRTRILFFCGKLDLSLLDSSH